MWLGGLLGKKTHNDEAKGAERVGPARGPASRWLIYGLAGLCLLWVLGRVSLSLAGLGTGGSIPPEGGSGAAGGVPALASDGVGAGPAAGGITGAAGGGESAFRGYELALAAELEALLSQVRGAGQVRVSVSVDRGPAYIFGYNTTNDTRTTEERDSTGGTRLAQEVTTSQQPVILRDNAQGERPLIAEEARPEVTGVLVLATGAEDSWVRLDLVRAVQALFPLSSHRITVLPRGR